MTSHKHRCGGTLYPAHVLVKDEAGLRFQYPVPGYRCAQCGEELIDHKTLTDIVRAHGIDMKLLTAGTFNTPTVRLLNVPSSTTTVA